MKSKFTQIGLTATVAIFLTACGGGSSGSSSGSASVESFPYDAPPISEANKAAYLAAVNNARATGRSCGSAGFYEAAPALMWNDGLYKAAYEHSQDMDTTGILTHSGSGGNSDWTAQVLNLGRASNLGDRIQNNTGERSSSSAYYENAAKGFTSLSRVMAAWLSSDGHCSAIMSKESREIGVAKVGVYWTQNFRN